MQKNFRPTLRSGLLSHRLDDQLLVFDKTDDQIHLLDGTTAAVFELLEQGAAPNAIEATLNARHTSVPGAELLALALDELAGARLVEGGPPKSAPAMGQTRRQMLQKLAGVGAAVLIPAIVTLTPNAAYAGSQLGNNAPCASNSGRCGSGCCCSEANTCRSASSCNSPFVCASP